MWQARIKFCQIFLMSRSLLGEISYNNLYNLKFCGQKENVREK